MVPYIAYMDPMGIVLNILNISPGGAPGLGTRAVGHLAVAPPAAGNARLLAAGPGRFPGESLPRSA